MQVNEQDKLIDARKLQNILNNKSQFLDWIKRELNSNKLKINEDYFMKNQKMSKLATKSYKKQYYLTEEAAKKIIFSQFNNDIIQKIKMKLQQEKSLIKIMEEIDEETEEIKIIKFDDEEYPEQLKQIKNPPQQLYIKGDLKNLKEHGIAIIGTRNCSDYGRRICKVFTNNLVGYNFNIISGLAVGIDSSAHKTCIKAKGKTIAVLPSGFANVYPKENKYLIKQIVEQGGTVITEYPPDFEKTSERCRERNRIISGLSIATLVIEAGKISGTSITVEHTNKQGKKVFCIPSSLLNSKGKGTNKMIKENRAKLVTEVEDIIKEFPELKLEKKENFNFIKIEQTKEKKTNKSKIQNNIDIQEENLETYNFLSKTPKGIDEIARALNKPINEIAYKLTLLELQGAIEELPGKKFKIK